MLTEEHDYKHGKSNKGKDADSSEPLQKERDHEAAEDGGQATETNKQIQLRGHERESDTAPTGTHGKSRKAGRLEVASSPPNPTSRAAVDCCEKANPKTANARGRNHHLPLALQAVGDQNEKPKGRVDIVWR